MKGGFKLFIRFLRESILAAVILTILRIYLGYGWFTGGYKKLTGGFDATAFIKGAVANPVKGPDGSLVFPTYVGFLKHFALPNADIFNTIIPIGETLVGIGLILGCLTTAAAFFALVMNFSYLMAGTISSNPLDILIGIFIVTAGFNAGRIGFDRWVIPFIRRNSTKDRDINRENV